MALFVGVYLTEFVTSDSGDWGSQGDFYFRTNDERYPNEGTIKLNANEQFTPDVAPSLYTEMVDGEEVVKLEFVVYEKDTVSNDTMLEHEQNIPAEEGDYTIDVCSDDGKVKMTLRVWIVPFDSIRIGGEEAAPPAETQVVIDPTVEVSSSSSSSESSSSSSEEDEPADDDDEDTEDTESYSASESDGEGGRVRVVHKRVVVVKRRAKRRNQRRAAAGKPKRRGRGKGGKKGRKGRGRKGRKNKN